MRSWLENLGSIWRGLRASDRSWFAAAVFLLALLGAGEILLHHGTAEVGMLYGDLGAAEQNAIASYLQANKIPYGVDRNALFVRKEMVDSLRAQIAERRILDEVPSDKIQNTKMSRAMEASARISNSSRGDANGRPICIFGGR